MTGRAPALFALLLGCGLGGGGSELRVETFPQSGLGAFRLLTPGEAPLLEAPFLLLPPGLSIGEPAVLSPREGEHREALRILLRARPPEGPPYLAVAEAPRLLDGAGDPTPLLVPEAPWEAGGLESPALVIGEAGLPPYLLLYRAGAAVGAAASDDGRSFRRAAAGPLAPAGTFGAAPRGLGAFVVGGALHLVSISDERTLLRAQAPVAAVAAALAGGPAPSWQTAPLGLSAGDFPFPRSSTEMVPAERLLGVSTRALTTPAGRRRYDLVVAVTGGGAQERQALGAAAAYDGAHFVPVETPLLGRPGGLVEGAALLTYQHRALLLLGLTTVRSGIAIARIP